MSPNIQPTAIRLISSLVYPPAISVFGNLGFCSCWSSYIIYNSSLAYQPSSKHGHPNSFQQVHQSFPPTAPPSSPTWLWYLKPTVFCTSPSTSISILLLQCSIGVPFQQFLEQVNSSSQPAPPSAPQPPSQVLQANTIADLCKHPGLQHQADAIMAALPLLSSSSALKGKSLGDLPYSAPIPSVCHSSGFLQHQIY